jgi:hypothetical protein
MYVWSRCIAYVVELQVRKSRLFCIATTKSTLFSLQLQQYNKAQRTRFWKKKTRQTKTKSWRRILTSLGSPPVQEVNQVVGKQSAIRPRAARL